MLDHVVISPIIRQRYTLTEVTLGGGVMSAIAVDCPQAGDSCTSHPHFVPRSGKQRLTRSWAVASVSNQLIDQSKSGNKKSLLRTRDM